MNQSSRAVLAVLALVCGSMQLACGPSIRTALRFDVKPVDDLKQTKEGLTVEMQVLNKLPDELIVQTQACNQAGLPEVDINQQPVMQELALLSWERNQSLNRVEITNSTDHVVRLNQAVVKLTDPASNTYELLTKEDLVGSAFSARPCAQGIGERIKMLKIYDRNVEIVPNSTWRGYIVFGIPAASGQQVGTWKYAFYDLPVTVDDAGRATKTTRFEMRLKSTKVKDTYRRESAFAEEVLVSSSEVE